MSLPALGVAVAGLLFFGSSHSTSLPQQALQQKGTTFSGIHHGFAVAFSGDGGIVWMSVAV